MIALFPLNLGIPTVVDKVNNSWHVLVEKFTHIDDKNDL